VSLSGFARWHYRYRWWVAAAVLLASPFLLPHAKGLEFENELTAWFEWDDPVYSTYRHYRDEFGGTRTLIVVVESDELFSLPVLTYLKELSDKLERLPHALRVYSLGTANRVVGSEDVLQVQPLLDGVPDRDPAEIRRLALADADLLGDLVSADARLSTLTVTFHEERSDPIRGEILDQARRLAEEDLPPGVRLHFNGSMEVSQEYDRVSMANMKNFTPPMFLLIVGSVYFFFRSWSRVVIVVAVTLLSLAWTLSVFGLLGYSYNVISTMILPLVTILAIADDMHLLQRFDRALSRTGDRKAAFIDTSESQILPVFAASLTTSLGMVALATSKVAAVRSFGIATGIGVMLDFLLSFALVPLALTLVPARREAAPSGERMARLLGSVSRFLAPRAKAALLLSGVVVTVAVAGMFRLRVSTNHVEFFAEDSSLARSARLIDAQLAGIYSFEVVLEGSPDRFKDPELLRRVDAFARRIESMPHMKRVISFVDSLKKVNRELGGGRDDQHRVPDTREAVAQEIFLFSLSEAGRDDLASFLTSDFSMARLWVKMQSTSSENVFRQILEVERLAGETFSGTGVRPVVTGAGRLFVTLDTYLVQSQISSFGTAFVTVFAVIFLVFRRTRFGILSMIPNVVPVAVILGLMGWLDITLNIATVMVASIALGVIDDDTVHFIVRYRREVAAGSDMEAAIETAIVDEGGAALLAAIVNTLAFGITISSPYKPTAFWGYLMSLTMALAFIGEVVLLPACLRVGRRWFAPEPAAETREAVARSLD
jgi:hypothetical protein